MTPDQARRLRAAVIASTLRPPERLVLLVGATTWAEYEEYLRPDGAIDRRFQPVLVEEPSEADAVDQGHRRGARHSGLFAGAREHRARGRDGRG
jgi:hypothetical protein